MWFSCAALIDTRQACDGQPELFPGYPETRLYHYVIVRADLPFGCKVAQTIHAAGESTPGRVPTGCFAVALAARDEMHLRALSEAFHLADIPHVLVEEPIEGQERGEAMAIGIEPTTDRSPIMRLTSSLPLVR